MLEAKAALSIAADIVGEAQAALVNAAKTIDSDHLEQVADAAQAEAHRIALAAVMIGGAVARLHTVAHLVRDERGAK
jgi:DNA-binding MurR/RpiR family transcriptional regulator